MIKRRVAILAATVAVAISLSGCSTIADPDQVGLYYWQGSSDGNKFGFCIQPGEAGKYDWNNEVYFLPTNLRTWNIGGPGSDSGDAIISSSKPQEGQPSGLELQVWPKITFYLNTFCDGNGGVVKPFWENLGKRYAADTEAGWKKMLEDALVAPLGKVTRDVTRSYEADKLVGNVDGILVEVQERIGAQFAAELKRLSGGDYFCGPTFKRSSPDCPPVEVIIKDVTFNDPGIQATRNEKQKALETAAANLARAQGEAAALLAKAEGEVNSAAKLQQLYSNPAWVALRKMELQLQAVQACSVQPNCRMIMGADGNIMITP